MVKSALFLGAAVLLNVVVGLLFKRSALAEKKFAQILLACALPLLIANSFCFRRSLGGINLSIAYPIFAATSMILICGASGWLFRETVSSRQILGMAVIMCGMALVCAK